MKKRVNTELEDLNGYFITMAEQFGMKIPYNRTIYDLCKERFEKVDTFQPLAIEEVFSRVKKIK